MKARVYLLILTWVLPFLPVRADEGMWLPLQIRRIHEKMAGKGLQLSAEDLYEINRSSVKDAIVRLGSGFCTAEIISGEGLLLTNHHCAFDMIQNHSAVGRDYLTDGFWAMKRSDELSNPGITASILDRMEDVTARMNDSIAADPNTPRPKVIERVGRLIAREITQGNAAKTADVRAIFYGNQFILSVYTTYSDVRLVGAPPSSIGKFGGDTDNWMWPRHTGDFSLLRIYTGADGQPAPYNEQNIPLKPRHVLPVSTSGVKEDDFVMVFGFPGTTNRYLTSANLATNIENNNQPIIDMLGARMKAYKESMDSSPEIRIALASTYASGMNTYKYFIGQNLGLKNDGVVERKADYEQKLGAWSERLSGQDRERFQGITDKIAREMKTFGPVNRRFMYFRLGMVNQAAYRINDRLQGLKSVLEANKAGSDTVKSASEKIRMSLDDLYTEYFPATEQSAFVAVLAAYLKATPVADRPDFLVQALKGTGQYDESAQISALAASMFSTSLLTDRGRMEAFLKKPGFKAMQKDVGINFFTSAALHYNKTLLPPRTELFQRIEVLRKDLMSAMMAFESERVFAPDANSTLRLTYGTVRPYVPRDAVFYKYFTTHEGILQKEDPSNEEFVVPARLKELLKARDFGRYGSNGVLNTCFLSDNDITGGNSGSPVINGRGELVGLAFDGNWESMTGDLLFSPSMQRTISVDIRYVLFIIDKFAGAGHLVQEMKLAN